MGGRDGILETGGGGRSFSDSVEGGRDGILETGGGDRVSSDSVERGRDFFGGVIAGVDSAGGSPMSKCIFSTFKTKEKNSNTVQNPVQNVLRSFCNTKEHTHEAE